MSKLSIEQKFLNRIRRWKNILKSVGPWFSTIISARGCLSLLGFALFIGVIFVLIQTAYHNYHSQIPTEGKIVSLLQEDPSSADYEFTAEDIRLLKQEAFPVSGGYEYTRYFEAKNESVSIKGYYLWGTKRSSGELVVEEVKIE